MSRVDEEEDPFEFDFDVQDLELTAALEEQLSSTQQASLFPSLNNTQQVQPSRPNILFPQAQAQAQQQRQTQIDPETAKLIEDLKQKLYLKEHQNKVLENKLRDSEELIKFRELENLNLKRQTKSASNDQPSTQSKRVFPQGAPRAKLKKRKASVPPETLLSSSSSEIINSMQSINLSSRHTSPSIRQVSVPATQSTVQLTQPYTPSVIAESQFMNTPRITPANPTNPIPSSAVQRKPPPPTPHNKIKKLQPKTYVHSELNMRMLKVLFADVFKEWNTNPSTNLNMMLVPENIRMFAKLFSAKFVPDSDICSLHARERLTMIASTIKDSIARSQDPDLTISSLLMHFGHCLSICIEEKLYEMINLIAKTLQELCSSLPVATDLLIKDVKFDLGSSNAYKLVQALSLYSFKKPPSMYHLVEENPNEVDANSTEIIRLAEKYTTNPPDIAEALQYENTPPLASNTVYSILSVLSSIGSRSIKSILLFLLSEGSFLNLLIQDTPLYILEKAVDIITLNTRDRNWRWIQTQSGDKKVPVFVTHLCQLLHMEHSPNEENWHSFSKRLIYLLGEICLMNLPTDVSVLTQAIIFSEVLDFLVSGCGFEANGKDNKHIEANKSSAKAGCAALLRIMKLNNPNLLEDDGNSIMKLRNLVAFYVDNNEDECHPARDHLLAIEKMLDKMKQ